MTLFNKLGGNMTTVSATTSKTSSTINIIPTTITRTLVNKLYSEAPRVQEEDVQEDAPTTEPSMTLRSNLKFTEDIIRRSTFVPSAPITNSVEETPRTEQVVSEAQQQISQSISQTTQNSLTVPILPAIERASGNRIPTPLIAGVSSANTSGSSIFTNQTIAPINNQVFEHVEEVNEGAGLNDDEKPYIISILSQDITNLGYAKKATLFIRRLKSERYSELEYIIYRKNIFTEEDFRIIKTIKTDAYQVEPIYENIAKNKIPIPLNELFTYTDGSLQGNSSYAYKIELRYDLLTEEEKNRKNITENTIKIVNTLRANL